MSESSCSTSMTSSANGSRDRSSCVNSSLWRHVTGATAPRPYHELRAAFTGPVHERGVEPVIGWQSASCKERSGEPKSEPYIGPHELGAEHATHESECSVCSSILLDEPWLEPSDAPHELLQLPISAWPALRASLAAAQEPADEHLFDGA